MEKFQGKSVFGGIAIGKIKVYGNTDSTVKRYHIKDVDSEINRFEDAKNKAKLQLKDLYDKAVVNVGKDNAAIFEVHQMMLEDLDYIESVFHIISSQKINAEYAVACTSDNFSRMFSEMEDEYMRERAVDVKDISNRVINILLGINENVDKKFEKFEENIVDNSDAVIIVADDLAPSQTILLDKSKVLSFVTRKGSTNSHTAILARTMNIPALIGTDFSDDIEGMPAIVDGYEGILIIKPDEKTIKKYKNMQAKTREKKRLLLELKGKPTVTLDGKGIMLYANIGSVADVMSAMSNDAEGIGLFRSEFLYLESNDYPTVDEQFNAYKTVAENMAGKRVIIRTLDIGADKKADYFNIEPEENPALGYRAIRICLDRVEIFKTQLRAIYMASAFGKISVMFPMITSVSEVKRIKEIIDEVKEELDNASILYGDVEIGIMIETPAAVMISDLLAKEVDFFSIGTNDLTQYTLAIDRQNPKLDEFYNPHHKAILRMIKMVVENGHKEGCFVGICGELAADLELTEEFVKMGVDELSVSPGMVLEVRNRIRKVRVGNGGSRAL